MRIGVRIPHTGPLATPDVVRSWCRAAEDLGFCTAWGVDHLVMPRRTASLYDLGRRPVPIRDDAVSDLLTPNLEVVTTLAFAAAVTKTIKLGTSVEVLTIRNAVLNARQLATVDRYSGGRLICGVGAGWLKEEADAMGMPWDRRGARLEEQIRLLRAVWTEETPHISFEGEFWSLPEMDPEPRPVQRPIPILIGGHSGAAIDRAVRIGDGWIASLMSPDRMSECLGRLRQAAHGHGRDPSTLGVYCSAVGPNPSVEDLRPYEALGITELQVQFTSLDELRAFGERVLPLFENVEPRQKTPITGRREL